MRENNNLDQINAGADGQDEGKGTLLSEEKNSAAGAKKRKIVKTPVSATA